MTAEETSKRDPRTRDQIEQIFPGRMWVIARHAAEYGWDISIRPTDVGWVLYLTEDHHCVHISWKPNRRDRSGKYPWDLSRATLNTRCRQRETVHVQDLPVWLANHPDECLVGNTRPPLAQLSRIDGCDDHILQKKPVNFWPRHSAPPDNVEAVATSRGEIWRPVDAGAHYWAGPGYPAGVDWNTLRQWSWLRPATPEEIAAAPPLAPLDDDPFMGAVREAAQR